MCSIDVVRGRDGLTGCVTAWLRERIDIRTACQGREGICLCGSSGEVWNWRPGSGAMFTAQACHLNGTVCIILLIHTWRCAMPWLMIWMLLGPSVVSVVIAVIAWRVIRRGARPVQVGRCSSGAVVAGAATVMAVYPVLDAAPLWIDAPSPAWSTIFDTRFVLPLVLGLLVLMILGAVRPRPSSRSEAVLSPRSWRSFLNTWWLGAVLGVLALIIGLTLSAGMASQPNDAGEYSLYVVDLGSAAFGTAIYGWHHSLIPSVLCVLLSATTWWTLSRIARPPLPPTRAADAADRRLRSTNALRVMLGALLLHLDAILHSLASTSRMTGSFSGGGDLFFSTGTPFSALSGTLSVLAQIAGILGLALWAFTALTAVRTRANTRSSRTAVPT